MRRSGVARGEDSRHLTLALLYTRVTVQFRCSCNKLNCYHIDGVLPKGPYPPCLRMADRALLARYSRYIHNECVAPFTNKTFCVRCNQSSGHKSNGWAQIYTPNYNYLHWPMRSATNQSLIRIPMVTRIYCADINLSTWRLLKYRNVDYILAPKIEIWLLYSTLPCHNNTVAH